MKAKEIMDLQMFANPNTNVTTQESLSVEMKTYYEKDLLEEAEPNLVHSQFADKYPIPAGKGKTIEFRKYDSMPKALTPLTEGVTPDGRSLNVSNLTATVHQYGDYTTISDVLKMTAIDDNIVQATRLHGSQAGRTIDTLARDVLAAGTNVIYAGGRTSRGDLTPSDILTPNLFFKAAAQLKAMNAPTIEGSYVAIIHPYAAYDVMSDHNWIDWQKYATPDKIFNGEIGKIGNVRFVETTEAKIWNDDSCPAQSYAKTTDTAVVEGKTYYTRSGSEGAYVYTKVTTPSTSDIASYYEKTAYGVFGTIVLGAHAYADVELAGGGLQTIVKQLGAGDDPLNQRATVGWKHMGYTAKRLIEQYMLRIESMSSYSATAQAN